MGTIGLYHRTCSDFRFRQDPLSSSFSAFLTILSPGAAAETSTSSPTKGGKYHSENVGKSVVGNNIKAKKDPLLEILARGAVPELTI